MLSRSSASSITRSMYGLALAMLANSAAVTAALDFFERDGIALPGDAWALKCQDTQSRHTNPANQSTCAPCAEPGTPRLAQLTVATRRSARPRCTAPLKRNLEHLSNLRDELEVEVLAQVLGDLVDVLLVSRRSDNHPDPTALS